MASISRRLLIAFFFTLGVSRTVQAAEDPPTYDETLRDVSRTLGIVPAFIRHYPKESLTGAWIKAKTLPLNSETALTAKEKAFIEVAVASESSAPQWLYFQTELAKGRGATEAEIQEAIAMAGLVRNWSTFLNGLMIEETAFRKEADRVMSHARKQMAAPRTESAAPVTAWSSASEAYADIERTLGFVPTFLRRYPEDSIIGAWSEMKGLQLSPSTVLSGKDKELVGLAVASQIPCRYCIYFHTQAARMHGASDQELTETLALSGISRQWSGIVAGAQIADPAFKRDVARIVLHMKAQNAPLRTGGQASVSDKAAAR